MHLSSRAGLFLPGAAAVGRWRLTIRGIVQGVGFRPFLYRLARELRLTGWVCNSPQGVVLEIEGPGKNLERFARRLEDDKPVLSAIQDITIELVETRGETGFVIRPSSATGPKTALMLPDLATCPDCRREIFDRCDRRYRYPFTNCTYCGPRFTIVESLPYDRARTTMKNFPLCAACQAEYHDPTDRRFHAQAIACPQCGPHLELWDSRGKVLASHAEALQATAEAILEGETVAVQGLGGFHLMVDATQEAAVLRLRRRKARPEKPLALMYPSLEWIKAQVEVSEVEERLLCSPEAPVVLLRRRPARAPGPFADVVSAVAPDNPYLGIMLPYTPLHHLLLDLVKVPLVATSGNRRGEPLCIAPLEALARLQELAGLFLVHNRPIARHLDDSIVRVVGQRELVLRRARGYVPRPFRVEQERPAVLAVGGQQKNTLALARGQEVWLSQHIGDLETASAGEVFQQVAEDLIRLYDQPPAAVASDLHPDYFSTREAEKSGLPLIRVQHHYAHVLSGMVEHGLHGPLLGVAWDGSGYGQDGTIWGGEFLRVTATSFQRVASFRPFPLPGGEQAVREPRRAALGLLYALFGPQLEEHTDLAPIRAFSAPERQIVLTMLQRGFHTPLTSSVGRLFDAVAALLDLRQIMSFEGQAAMALEFASEPIHTARAYPFALQETSASLIIDWAPLIQAILYDLGAKQPVNRIAARFHHTLADIIVAVARHFGETQVVLTGGCFQNRYLTEKAIEFLQAAGLRPYWHRFIPPNDGGLAVGQILAARRVLAEK